MAEARPVGKRLKHSRKRSALTQKQVAKHLEVPRELISMWETEARRPTEEQLAALAELYHTSLAYLKGKKEGKQQERALLLDRVPDQATLQGDFEQWLDFLDTWADRLEDWGEVLPGPGKPPRALDHGPRVTDARRAPTLADEVRDYYRLGRNALPNLRTFLDERGVLVCRVPLGPLAEGAVVGAFFNHTRLGYCVLVNASARPGRQAFAMAHAYAHGLYHYARRCVVCLSSVEAPVERFADTFAAHFLVPRKKLRQVVADVTDEGDLDAYQVVYIASYFRVSYATTLKRLLTERHISRRAYERMRQYSPAAVARRVGLDARHFSSMQPEASKLNQYPMSVLERVRRALCEERIDVQEAATLLSVDELAIREAILLEPPYASELELREFRELPPLR